MKWKLGSYIIFQLQSHLSSQQPISEFLAPETKTVIEDDCLPTFANILAARIVDMDDNRIVKSFGMKKGFERRVSRRKRISIDL